MSSGLASEFEDVFAGQPSSLGSRAYSLSLTADAIERAAEGLRDIADDQTSQATAAAADSATEAASGLRRAYRRYSGTANALTTFAVELGEIHTSANAAIADADDAADRGYRLQSQISDLNNEIVQAEAVGEPVTALRQELWDKTDALSATSTSVSTARQTLLGLRQQLSEAVDRAVNAIETASEHGADSWGDNWNQFWEGVGDFFEMLGEWASEVLAAVVAFLHEALSALVSALVVLLILLVVALVLGLVFAVFGLVGLLVVLAGLAILLLAVLVSELLAKPQQRDGEHWSSASDSDGDVWGDADEARDYQDLMQQLDQQDSQGGEGSTQIRVVAVRDADGNVISWRVQLPSTQNWDITNNGGALNDLRADIMLSMFPGVPTQYEQAVWDAMTEAGVFESDAPIMFTGWSLGGMMAGDLATDPRVADRVESVFTAGSAIDKHYSAMPPDVRVTQINNGIDPVHTLELLGLDPIDYVRFDGDWQTYRPLVWPMHDATMYGEQAEHYLPQPRPGDEIFFAEPGDGSYEDVYVATYGRGS